MRKLMWLTLGFGTACGVWAYIPEFNVGIILSSAVLAFAFCLGLCSRKYPVLAILAMILVGFSASCLFCQQFENRILGPLESLDGSIQKSVFTAEDFSFETGYGQAVDGRMELNGKTYSVRVYWNTEDSVEPGMVIRGNFQFRLTTPGSLRGGTSHSGKGIYLLAYQKGDAEFSYGEDWTFSMWAARLRRQIIETLENAIPEGETPFAKALLLGDVTDLSYEVDSALKISGIRHVAAVSGLHVSILFALISKLVFKNRFGSALLGFPALFLFAALAGFTPSVCRAGLMCGLMLAAMVLNREYDGLTALSFSVLVMLLGNPFSITSVSLQLSAASVAGIFLFSEPVRAWISGLLGVTKGKSLKARIKRAFAVSVATTLSAMVFTAPLSAWYFGTVSLIGVVTNLMTLWIISFLFYALMLTCLVYWIIPGAALPVGKAVSWMIRYVLLNARGFAAFPLACVYTESDYVVLWLVFVYILLILFLISHRKRPWLLAACASFGLCLALLCSWAEPLLYDTAITVLDVGQGQCILLQSEGKHYVVDCGGDDDGMAADQAASFLLSRGISHLDGLIVTHMDRDHAGGVKNLLTRIPADVVILPPVHTEIRGKETVYADRPITLSWANSRIAVFGGNLQETGNENSLCILLDTEKCDILITGDRNARGEEQLIRAGCIPQVDVLVAGHHGSRYATSQLLLETAKPRMVCISAGADNIYGHPSAETLQRLFSYGCDVYRTDLNGTITIRR